jgi:hypothetical protein
MVPLLDFKLIGTIFLPDTTFLTLGCLHVLSSHEQCTVIAHSFHASTTLKLKTEKRRYLFIVWGRLVHLRLSYCVYTHHMNKKS